MTVKKTSVKKSVTNKAAPKASVKKSVAPSASAEVKGGESVNVFISRRVWPD